MNTRFVHKCLWLAAPRKNHCQATAAQFALRTHKSIISHIPPTKVDDQPEAPKARFQSPALGAGR
jgi:hypothetical protein